MRESERMEEEEKALPELPRELMNIIIERIFTQGISTETDALRFRGVCKSWRSLVRAPTPPRPAPFTIKLPHPITPDYLTSFQPSRRGYFNLSQSILYLIFNPQNTPPSSSCWLTRIETAHSGKLRILDPFSGLPPETLPSNFPKRLDSLQLRVIELSKAFNARFVNTSRRRKDTDRTLVVDKAVIISDRVMVLYNQGDLGFIKLGSMRWKVSYDYADDFHNHLTCYDDLIVFNRKFCVVNRSGLTLLIDRCAKSAVEIARPICGLDGNPKRLVDLAGELYMVERDLGAYTTKFCREGETGRLIASDLPTTMAVKFKIYKLSEEDKQWVQVKDLGDSVLFLGYDCSFGFSARFLPGCKANCLYFVDECYTYNSCFHQGKLADLLRQLGCPEAGVYDLKEGTVKPLMFSPEHVPLLWPPPAWILSASSST